MPILAYEPGETVLHKMQPVTKLLIIVLVWIVSLVSFDIMTFLILLAMLMTLWELGKIPLRDLAGLMKLLSIVFLFFTLVNGFKYFRGKTPLFYLLHYPFTLEGLLFGITISLKVLTIVCAIPILTKTTTTADLISSLAKLRIPYQLIFILTTAISFTDIIEQTYNNIKESQIIRGYSLYEMNYLKRAIKGYLPLFVPLTLTTLRKASTMDIAIETRAFGALKKRTNLNETKLKRIDIATIAIITTICTTLLVLNIIYGKITLIVPA